VLNDLSIRSKKEFKYEEIVNQNFWLGPKIIASPWFELGSVKKADVNKDINLYKLLAQIENKNIYKYKTTSNLSPQTEKLFSYYCA
jgi:hypothetical protein